MTRNNATLQGGLAGIEAQFQRQERMIRWLMAGAIPLVALTLVLVANLLLKAQGAL